MMCRRRRAIDGGIQHGATNEAEYLQSIYERYRQGRRTEKTAMLEEFWQVCGYNRKYAIQMLNGPQKSKPNPKARRSTYGPKPISSLAAIWEARVLSVFGAPEGSFTAMAPLGPKALRSIGPSPTADAVNQSCYHRSTTQTQKRQLKKRPYNRTKPGTLLKHKQSAQNSLLASKNRLSINYLKSLASKSMSKLPQHLIAGLHYK